MTTPVVHWCKNRAFFLGCSLSVLGTVMLVLIFFNVGINASNVGSNPVPQIYSQVSPTPSPTPVNPQEHFLFLPFRSTKDDWAKGDWLTRMTSAFDHHYPDYTCSFGITDTCKQRGMEIAIWEGEIAHPVWNEDKKVNSCFKPGVNVPIMDPQYCGYISGYEGVTGDEQIFYDGHDGYDWRLEPNAPILAAARGTVTFVGWDGAYGWTVEIDHGNGYKTRYSHLQENQKNPKKDSFVEAGIQIGVQGCTSTGRCTGDHLHFSVLHNGKKTDPFGWCYYCIDPPPDPLVSYNGESSQNLWYGTTPRSLGDPPARDNIGIIWGALQTEYLGGPGLFAPETPQPPATEGAIDLFMLVDLSSSYGDDLSNFQAQARGIISALKASNADFRVGLGRFEDYPIPPFGSPGDKAYERLVDLTSDTDLVLNTIANLSIRSGEDGPESQLPALFQAATGAGQDLSGAGFPEASIPPGQQANFSDGATKLFLLWTDASFHLPGDSGNIPYPGPSFSETVNAILALDPPKVIGISSGGGGLADLQAIARATDALAPPGGVDCDNNGAIDIPEGEPLVCTIAASGEGISAAIRALVGAATAPPNVEESTISVPGNQPWTDTGLDLNQGDQVTITASGTIKIEPADPGRTPAGDPNCTTHDGQEKDPASENWLTPGLTCWSLVGRIGDGVPFQIGTGLSFSVETAGRLYLGVNDETHAFENNSGSWTVEVKKGAAPPETPPGATISVPGNQPWTDSGLDLAVGSSVAITASGTIKTSPSDPGKTPAGAPNCTTHEGQVKDPNSADWLTPGLSCWSLVGRIGDGAPFQIGTGVNFPVATAGRLYLGVNDEIGRFGNNSGSWTVNITISDAGEQTPSCPTPTVTLSASSGKAGDTITIQGIDWVPGGTVAFTMSGPEQYDIASIPVPDSGEWGINLHVVEATPPGDYELVFSENHEGCELTVIQLFTIASPSATLDPTEGTPGTQVTATGSGWPAGHEVNVQWEDSTVFAATTVDENGNFVVSFTVPEAAEGEYTIDFVSFYPGGGESFASSATFTVTTAADTEPPTVSWIKPVSTGESYPAASGIVELEVAVSDNGGIQSVEFYRWDAVNLQLIGITTDSSPPYQASVEVNTLNMEWNEILARVRDTAGNQAEASIFIYRQGPTITLNPIEGPPETEVTATGSGWPAGHEVSVLWEDGVELATPTVDGNGNFTVSFTIPDDAAEGQHTIDFVGFPPEGEAYVISAIFMVTASGAPSFGPAGSFIPFGCDDGRVCAIHSQAHKEDTGIPTIQYYVHVSRIPERSLNLADNALEPGQEPMLMRKMQEAVTGGLQKAEWAEVQFLGLNKLSELIDTLVSVAGGRVHLTTELVMGSLKR